MTLQADAPAGWSAEKERSSLRVLRLMRWIALTAGRRIARAALHPITLYFLATGGITRRESARYLTRALGRPARLGDVYRHFHCFAATILDRVYLLQERYEQFELKSDGVELMDEPLARDDGTLMIGAHLGSFEALRALGRLRGVRVAMIMYEDNARLINSTLAVLAPKAALHTIALGRLGAMLSLRHWLDGGGIAGLLGDRTLPVSSQRSRNHVLPFLGAPASFSDGPFRLAAMLRRPVIFMTGLYNGGHRYELRFLQLADFSAANASNRDALVREALVRYVEVLETLCREAPYNWFNFFDFWGTEAGAASAEMLSTESASAGAVNADAPNTKAASAEAVNTDAANTKAASAEAVNAEAARSESAASDAR
ncbi:MAG: acyl-CoA synthetase [Caldimonas sp.]